MTAHDAAAAEIRTAMRRLVIAAGGRTVKRLSLPDRPELGTTDALEPMAAIRAAVSLRHAAVRAVSAAARHAREDGRTWEEIGSAAGFEADPEIGVTPGIAVFRFLAGDGSRSYGPSFAWTCTTCRKTIIDRGLEAGHPADAESGHVTGCRRLAATIRAYYAEWEEN